MSGDVDAEYRQQLAALGELLEAMRGAYVVKVAPPAGFAWTPPPTLAELVDAASAPLPAKYRPHVLKLERQIRAALLAWQGAALDAATQVTDAADVGQAARWSFQAGILNGGLITFTGQRPPAAKPTPPPGGRVPRANR